MCCILFDLCKREDGNLAIIFDNPLDAISEEYR